MSRMSPVAVSQLVRNLQAKHTAQMEQLANIGDAAINQLRTELNGLTLVNWLLVKRLGGEVTIPDEDMEQSIGRLQMGRSEEAREWRLNALEPEPVEETVSLPIYPSEWQGIEGAIPAEENARVEGAEPESFSNDSDGYARSGDDE